MTEESDDMYVTRAYYAGKYIYVKNHSPMPRLPLMQRVKRWRETSKAMAKYNNLRRAEKLQLLILNNFDKGYHISLDYAKGFRPETYQEAEQKLTKCLHKVSRRLKKKGIPFKYIAVTERGKRAAALHHHLVVEHNADVLAELLSVWGNRMHISVMYEEGQYKDLADYLIKMETKEEQTKGKAKYHRSRNLKEPLERKAEIDGQMTDAPFVPEGYKLMHFENGYNETVGVRWQRYMLMEIPAPAKRKKSESMSSESELSRNHPESSQKCTKRESLWSKIKRRLFGGKK